MLIQIYFNLTGTTDRKGSLPGLGDGQDAEIVEIDKPKDILSEEDRARIKSFVGDTEEDEEDDVEDYVPAKKSRPSEEYFEPVRRNYGQPSQERFQRHRDQHLSHSGIRK